MEPALARQDPSDFSSVTESDEAGLTPHALAMNYHRYRFAADFCEGKDILEVACGNGQGLGFLARKAKSVVGGDYTEKLAQKAGHYYQDRLPVLRFNGEEMPFRNNSFNVIILFEAIYYFPHPEKFLEECRRLLRPGGLVIISTINCEWADFNPSPMSQRYFTPIELLELISNKGFRTTLHGAFPVETHGKMDSLVSLVKRIAVKLHLVPRSMKGKELLKRLFYGKLLPLPAELEEGIAEYAPPLPLDAGGPTADYRVIYAVGRLSGPGVTSA